MGRYFVLSLSLLLILLLFTCSGYRYDTASLYSEALIENESPSDQGENLSFAIITPAPAPEASQYTPIPKEATSQPEQNEPVMPEESAPPSSTPKPKVSISDIPDWYKSTENGVRVPILMYHNLLEGSEAGDGLNISEEAFDDQMKQLKAYGYNTITFSDLHEHYMDGSPLPKNPVIITFDDGYESNYTIGYPIFKKYGLNACIFIITNAIGNYNYMNESQLKEITSSGVIDVQSHSASHSYDLPYMSGNKIDSELLDSKMRLESITGNKVNIFCYPSGRYSQRLVDKLIEHEYIFSVTTNYGLASKKNNPFLLRRIRVMGSDSGKELKAKIETLTKRITEFIGIPEETIIPEQSPEPSIEPEPDQSTESDPQTSTEPEGPGQTDEDETKPSEESIMEESDSPEPDTTAQPKPDPESDLEDEAEPKTETEPEPESDPETDTVPEPESESASEESMITDP